MSFSPSATARPATRSRFWHELATLFALTWPILMTQVSQSGIGAIDSIMAGQYSAHDLAAVAIGVGLWLPCLLMINGVMTATTMLVAEAAGARKNSHIPAITQKALVLGLLLGIACLLLLDQVNVIYGPLKVPADLQNSVDAYLTGVRWSLPAAGMYAVLRGYTEGLGKPKPVTVISLLGLLLCIPLNWVFIYGYGPVSAHGGVGCGYATSIIFWVMTLVLGFYLYYSKNYNRERLFHRFYWPDLKWLTHFLSVGLPIGIAIFFEVSLFCLAALILSPLGTAAVAAHQLALSISSVLFMLPLSVSLALSIQVGQLYGARHWSRLRYNVRVGLLVATFLACVNIAIILLFRGPLMHQYTSDESVIAYASGLLLCAAVYQIFDAWQMASAGILRGLQDTKPTMIITLISYWVIALPLGVYLSRYTSLGPLGFWLGLIMGLATAALLLCSRLYTKLRHTRNHPDQHEHEPVPAPASSS